MVGQIQSGETDRLTDRHIHTQTHTVFPTDLSHISFCIIDELSCPESACFLYWNFVHISPLHVFPCFSIWAYDKILEQNIECVWLNFGEFKLKHFITFCLSIFYILSNLLVRLNKSLKNTCPCMFDLISFYWFFFV